MSDMTVPTSAFSTYGANPSLTTTSTISSLSNTNWNGNILLFFVALGFGILFCNLWVIIGIKYCYRYSSINRPETIEVGRVTPQNQVCQKKLMTKGEADQQFPSILYKLWQSQHKNQKQNSSKTISNNKQDQQEKDNGDVTHDSVDKLDKQDEKNTLKDETYDSNTSCKCSTEEVINTQNLDSCIDVSQSTTDMSCCNPINKHNDIGIYIPDEKQSKYENEYIKENVNAAISSNNSPEDTSFGDTCAICLDMFQDEDEVRVLTCGHIYHSSCIVPWFTTRRAMCPLCKYDFYVPETPTSADVEDTSRNVHPFPEVQLYEHRLQYPPMPFFSTYEPQQVEQYRTLSNNHCRNNLYNNRGTNRRNSSYRRFSRTSLFRRNHSFI